MDSLAAKNLLPPYFVFLSFRPRQSRAAHVQDVTIADDLRRDGKHPVYGKKASSMLI